MPFVRSASSPSTFFERSFTEIQKPFKAQGDPFVAFGIAAAVLALLAMLDTEQLIFMAVGAVGYFAFHHLQKNTAARKPRKSKLFSHDGLSEAPRRPSAKCVAKEFTPPTAGSTDGRLCSAEVTPRSCGHAQQLDTTLVRTRDDMASFCPDRRFVGTAITPAQNSKRSQRSSTFKSEEVSGTFGASMAAPSATTAESLVQASPINHISITAPVFVAKGLEAEVPELLAQITPTPACDAAIARIVRCVSQAINPMFPEAQVSGFANSRLAGSAAFGVAVPGVELLIDVKPGTVLRRLQRNTAPEASADAWGKVAAAPDEQNMQKHVLRKCAGRLVERMGFKFRRSAFGGQEPKVTLLLPAAAGLHSEPVPLDIVVNSAGFLRSAAFLTECGEIDTRAKALLLLVRRWAKDRGVSHAARGHLPPFAWSLLVVFYLQADGPILPPFRLFKAGGAASVPKRKVGTKEPQTTVARLFVEFFRFYAEVFSWQHEAVSILSSRRNVGAASGNWSGEARKAAAIVVEDPFEPGRNLAEGFSSEALQRLHEELARAHTMCSSSCSLTELLEPWMPPETVLEA